MHLIDRHRKPPAQVLRGTGINMTVEHILKVMDRYYLRRRVQVVTTAGVVRSRIAIHTYEATVAGMVFRQDEDGNRLEIQPGDDMKEWDWVQGALTYRHVMLHMPVTMRGLAKRPDDLVSLYDERTGKWVPATEWGK